MVVTVVIDYRLSLLERPLLNVGQ